MKEENERMRAENEAAEVKYRKQIEVIKKDIAARRRRDKKRVEQLMKGAAQGVFPSYAAALITHGSA